MAGNIKGITIEFTGDTSKLDKSLREIQKNTKAIDKELKLVDKALKFNPTSVELWRQKQQLLTQKIDETRKRLDLLKQKQAQMDAAGVDKNSEQYRKLQREIITTENQVKNFESQLRKVGNVNLQAASEQFKAMGDSLENAGQKMKGLSTVAAGVVAAIGTIAYKSGKAADDLNTMSKVTSISTDDLQKYKVAADLVDVSVEAIAKSSMRLRKNMYAASNGSKGQVEAFDRLSVSVTDANGELRNSDAVFQDVISALGKMENETERDAIAMTLMGKSASELNPLIEDGGETYKKVAETLKKYNLEFPNQETLDNANQFNDELDTMKLIGTVALQTIGTQLASYLAPALAKVVDYVGRFANWLTQLDPRLLTLIAGIAGFVAVMAPLLITFGKLFNGISAVIKVVNMLGGATALLAGPIGIAIAVILALVAAFVVWQKYGDKIKAWLSEFGQHIKNIFTQIKTTILNIVNQVKSYLTTAWNVLVAITKTAFAILLSTMTSPFTNAYNIIKGVVSKLKGLFPLKIGKVFSGLKLPHFKVSGGKAPWGLGGKGSLPHWSVDWYAKGGIFNSPTIAGIGEIPGGEAVVPLNKFWDKLDHLQGETNIVININGAERDPREIAEEVKRVLIRETNQRRLAWQ